MTHGEKVAYFVEDMQKRGVSATIAAPHLFRLAWMLGSHAPPPVFLGFLANFLWQGALWAILGASACALVWWGQPNAPIPFMAPFVLLVAVGLGAGGAAAERWQARKYELPAWDSYPSAPEPPAG
jgi:hypothetical protein